MWLAVSILVLASLNVTESSPPLISKHYRQFTTPAPTTATLITSEFLKSFCTLENFQKCIGEIWLNPAQENKIKETEDSEEDERAESKPTMDKASLKRKSSTDFPTSLEELKSTCKDLTDRVRCLDRHSELCFTDAMLQVFGHIVANAKQFVHHLCYNANIQKEFLVHAKCFRDISLDEQKCAQEYRNALDFPVNSRNDQHQQHQQENDFMRKSCCALQELVLCKRRHVREECGEAAAIFMRDHLPRITNPVLEQHCSAYTYGPGTCNEALYRQRFELHPGLLAEERTKTTDNGSINLNTNTFILFTFISISLATLFE